VIKKVDFAKFSSVKIGGIHEVLIVNFTDENFDDRVIIGGGNNILVSPNPPKLAMLGDSYEHRVDKLLTSLQDS